MTPYTVLNNQIFYVQYKYSDYGLTVRRIIKMFNILQHISTEKSFRQDRIT